VSRPALFAAAALAFSCAQLIAAAEPAIIAKARARLAPDAVLDAVTSIHYQGSLVVENPADSAQPERQQIDIILQKPAQQRIVVTAENFTEVSALDEYEAWRRVTDAKDPTKWQQSQLSAEQVKQLRADVWQNLSFFRGIERIGGSVEDQGPATIDGIACRKIAFIHSPTLVYYRYFDEATGNLVYTGDDNNNIRERGELIAGGIRFPKTIVMRQKAGDQTIVRTVTFEKITINETFPASTFAVPLPTSK
jgi:hypothetical protein